MDCTALALLDDCDTAPSWPVRNCQKVDPAVLHRWLTSSRCHSQLMCKSGTLWKYFVRFCRSILSQSINLFYSSYNGTFLHKILSDGFYFMLALSFLRMSLLPLQCSLRYFCNQHIENLLRAWFKMLDYRCECIAYIFLVFAFLYFVSALYFLHMSSMSFRSETRCHPYYSAPLLWGCSCNSLPAFFQDFNFFEPPVTALDDSLRGPPSTSFS